MAQPMTTQRLRQYVEQGMTGDEFIPVAPGLPKDPIYHVLRTCTADPMRQVTLFLSTILPKSKEYRRMGSQRELDCYVLLSSQMTRWARGARIRVTFGPRAQRCRSLRVDMSYPIAGLVGAYGDGTQTMQESGGASACAVSHQIRTKTKRVLVLDIVLWSEYRGDAEEDDIDDGTFVEQHV